MSARARFGILALACVCGLAYSGALVSASPFQDIPESMASAMGISTDIAELIMTGGILMAVVLSCAVARVDFFPAIIIVMVVLAIAVGVGWVPFWILLLAGLLVAALFASSFREGMVPGGG